MANPFVVACPADVWVLAAGAVTSGVIYVLSSDPNIYRQTYRTAGETAPVDDSDAISIRSNRLNISNDSSIDVYVKAVGRDGSIRTDL